MNIKSINALDVLKMLWDLLPEQSNKKGVVFTTVNIKDGKVLGIYKPKSQSVILQEHHEILYLLDVSSKYKLASCIFGEDQFEKHIPRSELVECAFKALYECHRAKIEDGIENMLLRYPHLA